MKDVTSGGRLRAKRSTYGWSAKTVGELYGNFLHNSSVTAKAILRMEEGSMPKGIKRRMVLACIYGLIPAVLGIPVIEGVINNIVGEPIVMSAKPVDIDEYRNTLIIYWKQGHKKGPEEALKDIGGRIYAIHDTLPYTSQKETLKQILCGYHLRAGEIHLEVGKDTRALDHLNKAVILAQEEELTPFNALTHYRRGEFFFHKGAWQDSINDLTACIHLHPPASIRGRALVVRGAARTKLVQTATDFKGAMADVEGAEKLTGKKIEAPLYALDFTEETYLLNSAKAWMGAPVKNFRSTTKASDLLTEMRERNNPSLKRLYKYRLVDSHIIEAMIYADLGYHPIAVTLAQNALEQQEILKTRVYTTVMESLYNDLKASPYGNDLELTEFGLRLLAFQFPQIFH